MRLYSSFSRQKEELPARPARIGMYFCGPTVYQRIHVGNARPFVISMWLRNWLRLQGYEVTLVENITDINDRIYEAAPGRSAQLAEDASHWYQEDTDLLGLGRPDEEPKASETVPEIVALIRELISGGLAYEAGGDVYFRVARFPDYGRLSGQRPDEVQEQEPNPLKEDPRDFALWKGTKEGEDTWWDSPWGRGRPGWHIECSAMAEKYLGSSFEIHGGGLDLVFPHHENEVAQSRGAGRDFARIWMHNGMLRLTGEKMSKSLGNIATLREVVEEWGRETLLLFFMGAHWRSPIDFSTETMGAAKTQAEAFRNAFRIHEQARSDGDWAAFARALDDDFNTADALAVLHNWSRAGAVDSLERGLAVFGLEALAVSEAAPAEVVDLAERRTRARADREFGESDRLRDEIAALGWEVRDVSESPGYTLVRRS
jgi:cysteinyl-tRNA synthetase